MNGGIKIKTAGYAFVSFAAMYAAVTQDFKIGGILAAVGGLIIAMGDLL